MDLSKTGLFISSMRKERTLTQKELADKIGVTDKAVSRWETGKGFPDVSLLLSLAEALGVSVTEIIRGERMEKEDKQTLEKMDQEQIKTIKPLKPLLDNLSLLGYVLIAAASSGSYELTMFGSGAPFIVWIVLGLAGGVCLMIRNREYYKQHGKIPSIIFDVAFVLAVLLIPRIPDANTFTLVGYFTRIIQVLAIVFIPIYVFVISPWRKNKKVSSAGKPDMKTGTLKNKVLWIFGTSGVLFICYVLSRHDVLGNLWHNMSEWPFDLFIFGLIVIVLAGLGNGRKIMISVPVGYITGFILAAMFNSYSYHPYEGRKSNGWMIWMFSYLAVIAVGIIWQIISKIIRILSDKSNS
jgi:transcriptional regulator with XRE-family HTH domain